MKVFILLSSMLFMFACAYPTNDQNKAASTTTNIPTTDTNISSIDHVITNNLNGQNYFSSSIEKMVLDKNNNILAIEKFKLTQTSSFGSNIKIVNSEKLVSEITTLTAGEFILDIAVHDNGNFTILETKQDPAVIDNVDDKSMMELVLRTFNSNYTEISRFVFFDSKQNSQYKYTSINTKVQNTPKISNRTMFLSLQQYGGGDFARIESNNNQILLSVSASYFGEKIFKFDISGTELWQNEIKPLSYANSTLAIPYTSFIASTSDNRIVAIQDLNTDEDILFEQYFGNTLTNKANKTSSGNLIMRVFDTNGTVLNNLLIPHNGSILNTKILNASEIGIIDSNNNQNTFIRVNYNNMAIPKITDFAVTTDNYMPAMVYSSSRNTILSAGFCGFDQTDTGSVTSYGKICIAKLDTDGNIISLDKISGDRQNAISSIIEYNGKFAISGISDGPITHSGDRDKSQLHSNGFIGVWQ